MDIIVDVDLTVADFVGAVCKLAGNPDRKIATKTDWFLTAYNDEIVKHIIEQLKQKEWWLKLPTITNANKGIAWLRGQGHNLIWVTVPYNGCLGWYNARSFWLDKNFNYKKHNEPLITVSNAEKYHIWADAIIDDMPDIVDTYGSHNPSAMCLTFKSELNSHLDRELVTWDDIMSMRYFWYGQHFKKGP